MEIIKLGDVCEIVNGKDLHSNISLHKILTNNKTSLIYVKTSCFSNGYQLVPKFFVKEKYINDINVPKLIVNKGDLVISKACNVGEISFIKYDNVAIYRALTLLVPHEDRILKKYLFYYLKKNKKDIENIASGTTIKTISLNDLYNFKISFLPNLKSQQQIIDIIEPKESLFLKYKDLVRIENIEDFKSDWETIIDIIEPFENLKYNFENKFSKLNVLLKNISYLKNNNGVFLHFSDLVIFNKIKSINSKYVLDLSVIQNDSYILETLSYSDKFNTNIFSAKKGNIFISSIRPKLKKYGIIPFDMNILGTLYNFEIKKSSLRGLVIIIICSDSFLKYQEQKSYGTKMPVVSYKDILNYKFFYSILIKNNIYLFNIFFDWIILLNKILIILHKIIKKLISIYIK